MWLPFEATLERVSSRKEQVCRGQMQTCGGGCLNAVRGLINICFNKGPDKPSPQHKSTRTVTLDEATKSYPLWNATLQSKISSGLRNLQPWAKMSSPGYCKGTPEVTSRFRKENQGSWLRRRSDTTLAALPYCRESQWLGALFAMGVSFDGVPLVGALCPPTRFEVV